MMASPTSSFADISPNKQPAEQVTRENINEVSFNLILYPIKVNSKKIRSNTD